MQTMDETLCLAHGMMCERAKETKDTDALMALDSHMENLRKAATPNSIHHKQMLHDYTRIPGHESMYRGGRDQPVTEETKPVNHTAQAALLVARRMKG